MIFRAINRQLEILPHTKFRKCLLVLDPWPGSSRGEHEITLFEEEHNGEILNLFRSCLCFSHNIFYSKRTKKINIFLVFFSIKQEETTIKDIW